MKKEQISENTRREKNILKFSDGAGQMGTHLKRTDLGPLLLLQTHSKQAQNWRGGLVAVSSGTLLGDPVCFPAPSQWLTTNCDSTSRRSTPSSSLLGPGVYTVHKRNIAGKIPTRIKWILLNFNSISKIKSDHKDLCIAPETTSLVGGEHRYKFLWLG